MKFGLILLVAFNVISLARGQDVCNAAVVTCGDAMYAAIDAANTDNALICTAVDAALLCVATETASCSLSTKADVSAAMNDLISMYTDPTGPYQCTLINAANSAFTDPCPNDMAVCVNFYYEAEVALTTSEACLMFDNYKECLLTNTTSCTTSTDRAFIDETITNTTAYMNDNPYYCSERDNYDIQACDAGFLSCVDPLNVIGTSGTDTSSTVCSVVSGFSDCIQTNNALCSPRLQGHYNSSALNLTITFQGDPYYCGAANPCLEAFKGCNSSELELAPTSGCGLLAVYDACMGAASVICDANMLSPTLTEVDSFKQQIDTEFGCSTTTTESTSTTSTSTTTTTTTTTTTSIAKTTTTSNQNGASSSPNQNQNGGSTPDFNQFYGGASSYAVSKFTMAAMLLLVLMNHVL